ncbi:hypothetical protein B0H14DRAFT_2414165, partial [Mycena olivaceomarginata]
VLFSETDIWPIKYRRIYLALKNLVHIIKLKDQDRPVWNALQESLDLARAKKISWVNDLRLVLSKLHIPVELNIQNGLDVPAVEEAMKAVKHSMEAWIDNEIETSARTKDLLTGRLEMDKDTGKLVKKITGLSALLAREVSVERRRWKKGKKHIAPREWRLCRFCQDAVEDPSYAMFMCEHQDLTDLREIFLSKLYTEIPDVRGQFTDPVGLFKGLLARREITPLLAKLAFDVMKVYDAV